MDPMRISCSMLTLPRSGRSSSCMWLGRSVLTSSRALWYSSMSACPYSLRQALCWYTPLLSSLRRSMQDCRDTW